MKNKNKYGLGWIFAQTKGSRVNLAFYTLLTLFNTAAALSISYFLKIFVDIATGESDASLLTAGLTAVAIVGLGGLFIILMSVQSKRIYGKTERRLRTSLLSVIFTRRMTDIAKQHTGELQTKLTVDVQAVSQCFPLIIEKMFGGLASAILATAAMFFLNWKMALIMLGLTPLMMLVMGVITPRIQTASEIDKENDESNRSVMQEYLSRIMLVKAYHMQKKTVEKVRAMYAEKLKSGMKLGFWEGLAGFAGLLVSYLMFMTSLGVGAYFVLRGETTLGNLIALVQLLNFVVNPLANFAGTISQVSQAIASAKRIGSICDLPEDRVIPAAEPVDAAELTAENICFSYGEEDETPLLENINATFAKGKVTGIAGKSGSGKSTLLKILIGLYAPNEGAVTLRDVSGGTAEVAPQVAYVPPADYLFSGTVTENIIMDERETREDDMRAAAAAANIHDFISSLPDGFDTVIGESGGTVSSGQAQRLAIARALYKKSPVIVFDEPTANLDVDSVELFQNAVRKLAEDKICIIVTHDLSTISVCDKVYVLEDGSVHERREGEELVMESS